MLKNENHCDGKEEQCGRVRITQHSLKELKKCRAGLPKVFYTSRKVSRTIVISFKKVADEIVSRVSSDFAFLLL
jgi:hypothetical protein